MVTGEAETMLTQLMLGQLVEIRTTSPGFAVHVDCPKELQPSLSLDFITSILVEAALSSCTTLDDAVTLKGCISTAKKAGLVSYQHLESLVAEKERAMSLSKKRLHKYWKCAVWDAWPLHGKTC
jgi:hypothetical protein